MNYQQLINHRDSLNTFAIENGVKTEDVSEGYAKCTLDLDSKHFNIINTVHGGALYTLMDSTAGACATSYGFRVTTVSSSVQFLNAVKEPIQLICIARTAKQGNRIIVVNTVVEDITGHIYCKGVYTFMNLKAPFNK